jgi:hypothetical protein
MLYGNKGRLLFLVRTYGKLQKTKFSTDGVAASARCFQHLLYTTVGDRGLWIFTACILIIRQASLNDLKKLK